MKRRTEGVKQNRPCGAPGLARIHVILFILCAALFAVAVLIPSLQKYEKYGERVACAESLRVVNGALIIQLLDQGEAERLDDAEEELASVLPGREGFCPHDGTVYFRKDKNGAWKAVCGLHDPDEKERTRLNASYVLAKLHEKLRVALYTGDSYPPVRVTVELNGEELDCRLVIKETGFKRGTSTTKGYENRGTVVSYGIRGFGDFAAAGDRGAVRGLSPSEKPQEGGAADLAEGGRDDGLCYFSFADENNNATWREAEGWSGSSYGDRY